MISEMIISIGEHKIIHGDAMDRNSQERLLAGQKWDILFTDPPFDLYNLKWLQISLEHANRRWAAFIMTSDTLLKKITRDYYDLVKRYFTVKHAKPRSKSPNAPTNTAYYIVHLDGGLKYKKGEKKLNNLLYESPHKHKLSHFIPGWAKDPQVISEILSHYVEDGNIVFDPFVGSGATIVAAHENKAKCYGIEKSMPQIVMLKKTMREMKLNQYSMP